jgi:FKBP-type peptidyl-prolyl cis-trans isomerase FkpA
MKKIIFLLLVSLAVNEMSFAQEGNKKTRAKKENQVSSPNKSSDKKTAAKKGNKPSASDKNAYKTSSTGVKYIFYKDVPGANAQVGDVVVVHMILKTSKDSVLRNTYKEGEPVKAMVQKSQFKGSLEDAFLMLSPGDSAAFLVNTDSLRKLGAQLPREIENGSSLVFILKTEKVLNQEQLLKEQKEMESKQNQIDSVLINDYISANKLSAQKTSSGLYYIVKEKGTGAQPQPGQTVVVHYTGKLLNGNKFDSSVDRGTPFEFKLGAGQVIQGWDEGIALMKVGEKGTLLIPSSLGYGPRGAGGAIPPNAVLIFDVELVGIK